MTFQEWQQLLKRISYKPGVDLEIVRHPSMPTAEFLIGTTVPNRDDPSVPIRIGVARQLPHEAMRIDEQSAIKWLWSEILSWEAHEAAEWFKVDGVRLHEPHKDVAA